MVHVVFEETSRLFFFVLQTLSVMPPRQAPLKYTVYGFLVINKHEKKTYYKINKCYLQFIFMYLLCYSNGKSKTFFTSDVQDQH